MKFKTKEDAIHFVSPRAPLFMQLMFQAEKQGWDYTVVEPKTAKIPPKNYG